MENNDQWAETLEKRCSELEKQVQYYKAIAEEAGQNRLREVEQLNRQIFERKKAEEKIKNSDKRIRSWLEYSPVCTKILDHDFHLQYMSSAGINCLQIKDITQFYGKKFPLICYPEPTKTDIAKNLEKIRETGEVITLETPVNDTAGNTLWFQSTFVPVADEAGRCDYIIVVSVDMTDRKRAEETQANLYKRLRQSQTIEAIGLMAGSVAHDLNNILSGIIGYPELILKTLPDDSDLRESIVAIKNSGYRAAAVVADLLTLARGVAGTREDHDLHSIIKEQLDSPECKELSVLPSKVKLEYQLNAQESYISCSPVHIKKCLMNLIINAAEAVTTSGTINITTSNHSLDRQAAAECNLKVGDYILLNVKDNGPGISEKDLGHIFEPFYTKKKMGKSGTGLGLMVVFNTVEEHGGRILVQSTDDGTCFQMYFPLAVEKRDVPRESKTAEAITGQKEHILVVDDDPQILDLASKMLTTLGYTADSVCSGEQAVKFVEKQSVDLIVLDMLMEPGLNGYKTYKEIIRLYPNQKTLIASGFSVSDDVEAAMKLGAGGFIKKPYSIDQFGQAVKEVLNS
jgi:PAS domain S-box-containing protein